MKVNSFTQVVETARQRAHTLLARSSCLSSCLPDLTTEVLHELASALEELSVAEEELYAQSEQLATAYQQIDAERQRYKELFEFAPDGYIVTDFKGSILEVNNAGVSLLQIPKNFLTGKLLIHFVPLEERQTFRHQLLRLSRIDRIQEWEIWLQPRKNSRFFASLSVVTVRNKSGQPVNWRWQIRDITARKRAEEQLQKIQLQNMQLQEAARVKSEFLALVSHELRTPMNTILGFSQLLLRLHKKQFTPQSAEMVERIIGSGQHLLKLIEEILDFSKLEAGHLELKLQEFELRNFVTKTIEGIRILADQKNLTLTVKVAIEETTVTNDCLRLHQILVNLVSNAIKFTEVGEILVEVQQLPQDKIAIIVRDTGVGIAETDLKYVFKEFWQAACSSTHKQAGSGLGLAICKQLVGLMNGKITVESKLGKGSTFRVELPRQVQLTQ